MGVCVAVTAAEPRGSAHREHDLRAVFNDIRYIARTGNQWRLIGVLFNERVIKVDDPCGAISVDEYCGWLGAVCVGMAGIPGFPDTAPG